MLYQFHIKPVDDVCLPIRDDNGLVTLVIQFIESLVDGGLCRIQTEGDSVAEIAGFDQAIILYAFFLQIYGLTMFLVFLPFLTFIFLYFSYCARAESGLESLLVAENWILLEILVSF